MSSLLPNLSVAESTTSGRQTGRISATDCRRWIGVPFFEHLDADEAARCFTEEVIAAVDANIPAKWITDKVYAHPWLNDECRQALREKHVASGTPAFAGKRDACTSVFREAHQAYVSKTRDELKAMSSSSRGWWKLSGSLLMKASGRENIPPLKRAEDQWAKTAREKADELARVANPSFPRARRMNTRSLTSQLLPKCQDFCV